MAGLPLVVDGISAETPPLLLLHGFTGSHANWQPFVADWGTHFELLRVDLPGHGEPNHGRTMPPATPDPYRMPATAHALISLLDEQQIEQINLLGYSMGGRLALYLACHYPERINRLVLESSSPGLKTAEARNERIQRDNALADFIEREGMEAFVARWEKLALWDSQKQLDAATRQSLHEQRLRNNPVGLANSLRGMGTGQQPSLWPLLSQIAMPTLLITGELDTKFVGINREISAEISHARLEIITGAGHTVHLERPSLFSKHVLHFLTSWPAAK